MRHIQYLQAVNISNGIRNTSFKLIVGQNYDRHRRVSDVFRQGRGESVVVHKNSIKIFLKKSPWKLTFKFIVPDIQILEARQSKDMFRKLPCKPVVAKIQLKQELQIHKTLGNHPTKPV